MTVRPYEPKDFETIKEWGKEWDADYNEDQFPQVGFIVDGVAAYFLYQTDSSVCFLENMVSKRYVNQGLKNEALELISAAILKKAKEEGFKVAYACTNIYSVAKRAQQLGARVDFGHLLITKDLADPSL